ncbi:nucleoside-triphosphatase [bacterium]|nr:nucleoside-triphosphatase [bacterium]
MRKHILLTGARGAGKSTLIRRLCAEAELPVYGFVTKREEADETGFHPIYIHPAWEEASMHRHTRENLVGTCNQKIHNVCPVVFDALGVRYLAAARPGGLIVMDELGFMEAKAEVFKQAVLHALGGDIPVLAAVKDRRDVPFLNAVCSAPKAALYTVTSENREALFAELLPIVKAWRGE